MDRAVAFLAGAGVGAGLMFLLDPQMGRRRRAIARDKAVSLAHQAEDAAEVVARDVTNRARGLASGDMSVLVGGRRALRHPLRGGWSPSARTLMGLLGAGLFVYGLTREEPTACVIGSVGLGLTLEGLTNLGLDDLTRVPRQVAGMASNVAGSVADNLGFGAQGQDGGRERATTPFARSGV